jgi:Protein of unknown function (DUF4065)
MTQNEHDKNVVAYIIKHFNGKLNRTAVMKLVYLCELEYISNHQERLTQYPIKHYNHGAYAKEIDADISLVATKETKSILYYQEPDQKPTLPREHIEAIDKAVKNYKFFNEHDGGARGNSLTSLISNTYRTKPFLETPFNELINFEKYFGVSDIKKVLMKKKEYERLTNPKFRPVEKELNDLYQSILKDFDCEGF